MRDPDRKGKVESGVGHAKKTPLKGQRFESLAQAQAYLDHWEERWADTRIHGTTKRQVAAMFAEEKPALLPLPLEPFRYYQYGKRKVIWTAAWKSMRPITAHRRDGSDRKCRCNGMGAPSAYRYNLRSNYILNSNYADFSFLFTPQNGEPWNDHLDAEYLAALETNQSTPYYLNLHYQDIPHTLMLGMTGTGKSFTCNFLLTHAQKYAPRTVIFDLGGSYRMLTQLFGGSYMQLGIDRNAFLINPFSLPPSEENLHFLFSFVKVLIESSGTFRMADQDERELYSQIASMYHVDRSQRRLITLLNILPKYLESHLRRWVQGGQYGNLFDNVEDNLTLAHFQTFDFEGLDKFPQILEPLLFYILHRANAAIYDPALATTFKIFLLDEAWRFFRNPTIKDYIIEGMKTWRKRNAAVILATQSSADLTRNEMLQVIAESCGTLIFLANPRMDKGQYKELFHLNDKEADLIAGLTPKKQMLIKRPDLSKVVQLNVASKDYWIYTNSPYDNDRKRLAFERLGFARGLEFLAGQQPVGDTETGA